MATSFDLAAVEAAIAETIFAGRLHYFASTGSTNTLALEAARAGAEHGVWIADEQTAGRGRSGHTWHSQAGDGLYFSVLVRAELPLDRALRLSLATGLAAQFAIANVCHMTPDIRWPNDLLLAGRKCGGILVETAIAPTDEPALRYAVIGIGLNVNHAEFPPELAELATSLRKESGRPWPRETLLTALLLALDTELRLLQVEGQVLLKRFTSASTWMRGKHVRVGEDDGGYTGVTAGLTAEGFLLVQGDDGSLHTVVSGGVRAL